jgi:hypothetical protein
LPAISGSPHPPVPPGVVGEPTLERGEIEAAPLSVTAERQP